MMISIYKPTLYIIFLLFVNIYVGGAVGDFGGDKGQVDDQ